jgi:Ca2+-transporting ATPase
LTPWHTLAPDACAARLGADLSAGLAADEAARRLRTSGPNRLHEPPRRTRLATLASQFRGVLVVLLAVAAIIVALIGNVVDAAALLAVLVLNSLLGYLQERRADDAVAALRRMTAPTARVRRGGSTAVVPAAGLVPGDVVVLEAGDRIPADVRLVRTLGFRTVESALTGESDAVAKDAGAIAPETAPVADRSGMAWMGTIAAAGNAVGVVVATGGATEFGRIAALVRGAPEKETPLQERLRTFGRVLAATCGAVCVLVFVLGLARGIPFVEMALAAVSLAVAAVPEGLPAIVTIALAFGVAKMAKRHVLIRRLPAVETLGCTSVICSDKTGTLTVGEMTVRTVASVDFEATVGGDGYEPQGDIVPADAAADARRVLFAAAACSTARLVEKDGDVTVAGDPTEGALVVAARKAGVAVDELDADEPVVGGFPFDAQRRRMSIARSTASGVRSYVKGAPEAIVPNCTQIHIAGEQAPLAGTVRGRLLGLNHALAARGLRVLAVARRDFPPGADPGTDAEEGLTFLGLVGMQDPPRDSARAAVAACRGAGIRPVMITGDQPATALAIARELGIATLESEVMTGAALDAADDAALAARVASTAVYARVTPEHKLRIVEAWRSRGDVVAMTGDGVNDAPALKGADIGVAMGRTGTDVAKDAAAMIVADDDFASIVAAVEEGRRIFENIRKTLLYLLSGNLAEILVMTVAVVAGWPLPLVPIQLLWINLVTEGLPAVALAMDPADPDLLRRPPRRAGTEIADRGFLLQIAASAALVTIVTLAGFLYGLHADGSVERARTFAFSILVIAMVLRAFAARHATRTFWEVGALSNARLSAVVALAVLVQLWSHRSGALERFLHTGGLTWSESAVTLALGAVPVTVLEVAKLVRRAFSASASAPA